MPVLLFIPIIADIENNTNDNLPVFQGEFVFPFQQGTCYTFTQKYGAYDDGAPHYANDLHTDIGTLVVAPVNAKIIEKIDGNTDNPIPSYYDYPPFAYQSLRGNYITLAFVYEKQEYFFRFMHFKQNTITVKIGQEVHQGDILGEVGNSGLSWGAHLHFEVRNTVKGASSPITTIDPNTLIDFGGFKERICVN